MERRIAKQVRAYHAGMKDAMKAWFMENDPSYPELSAFLQFAYDYPVMEFQKEDFQKRRRVKNMVPLGDRCVAKRANDEQCTRRKRLGSEFCGTHAKGTPHGTVSDATVGVSTKNVELWVQDIKGIHYYLDADKNVYSTEDVIGGVPRPTIVGHALIDPVTGQYSVPELGI
jgi:hypothetical protein